MAETMFYMKQNDLLPSLVVTCLDSSTPVNLTSALSARLLMRMGTTLKINRAMSVMDQTNPANLGKATLVWAAGDTDTVGKYKAEIEIMWPGNKPQTFPGDGYFTVVVVDDLDIEA